MKKQLLLISALVLGGSLAYGQINTFPYTEDFENGPGGWVEDNTTNGTWELADPANPVINSAASGDSAWITNGTGNYNSNENSWVESPQFDFTGELDPTLSMDVWWNAEFSWDGANVTYSTDGGTTWNLLGNNGDPNNWYTDNTIDGNPGGSGEGWTGRNSTGNGSGGWVTASHDVPGAGGQGDVRFRVNFGSDGSVTDDGFAFDNILVTVPVPVDLEATSVDSLPTSSCGLGMEDVWVTITENGVTGLAAGDTIFATYNDGTTLIEDTIVLANPLGGGMTYNHMFSQLVDYSTVGTYNITVTIATSADGNTMNNTATASLTNILLVNTFPYLEDFETGPNGWLAKNTTDGATNGTWQLGTPAMPTINSALSGDSAWATNLTGNYNANTNAWVESPCFDMTAATGNEQLAMGVWWESEISWDGANVTYTTDGGTTWSLLGNFGDPGNWYNDNTISGNPGGSQEGWTGSGGTGSGQWVYAKHDIPAPVFASSDVKFRVNFGSDGSVQQEGFAFDNFAIAPPPNADVFPDTISVCDTILGPGTNPGDQWLAYLWDSGETTQFSNINTPGIHWVEVTGPFGTCARDSFFVDTFYYALPPNLEDDRLICYPNFTTLDAGADTVTAYTYLWSTGETTSSIMTNSPGVYTVTKQDAGGNCSFDDTITITVARVDLGPSTIGYCTGAAPTLDAGPGGVTYLWSTNDTTQTITPTGPGAYGVTVIDTNGCVLIDAVDLVESIPVVDLGPDQTICVYNTTTLDAGTWNGYLWSEGTTTQTLTLDGSVLGTGTYNYDVTVTDSVGCTGTDAIVVVVDACAGLEDLAELGMTISPNPSEGVFNYTVENFNEISGMQVLDLTGKLVEEITVEGTQGAIDLTNYESGVYILRIQAGDNTTSVRLIKQ